MLKYDAVLVGAGPIGGYVAARFGKKFNTLIIEEHHSIGKPVQCAGLVTPRVLKLLSTGNFDLSKSVLNRVRGAVIYSPSGRRLVLDAGKPRALVIDRTIFDREIVSHAVKSGSKLWLGTKFLSAHRGNGRVILKVLRAGQKLELETKLLIGADGAYSAVARNFEFRRPNEFLAGFETESENVHANKEFVELFVGNEVAPGFFGWAIPLSSTSARLGLCVSPHKTEKSAYYHYKKMLDMRWASHLKRSRPYALMAGSIPVGLIEPYQENVMLVGDAAAQVKPTTGGGLYTGLVCASHCASIGISALESERYDEKFLAQYSVYCGPIFKELRRGMRLRKFFVSLSDKKLETAFDILSDEKVRALINRYGDLDFQSRLALLLLRKFPKLIRFAYPLVKSFF